MLPSKPGVHGPEWSTVPRTLAVLLPACALVGCSVVDASSGVAVTESAEIASVPSIAVTPPPPEDGRPTEAEIEAADVVEVDTVVEPEVRIRPSTIAVVGDSLTVSAREELAAALGAAGLDVIAIDAQEGRRMAVGTSNLAPGQRVVEEILAEADPELWVIALGTNDVASVDSLDGFRADIRGILDLVPPEVPVVWVDLYIRDRTEPISRANLQIRAELGGREGGAAVVDWFSHGTDAGVITGDGVHLTPAGQQLFADSIVKAVDELFPRS